MPLDIVTRAAIVTLKAPAAGGKTTPEIHEITGIPKRTINDVYARAIKRGFDPEQRPFQLLSAWLEDAARSGRPLKRTPEVGALIISKVSTDRFGREKTAADIAGELRAEGISISRSTVLRFLKISGYKKTKPTRKPGLTAAMRKERLAWCIAHKDWTLEDWKNVIWSDETSVVLLHRRGSYRVWRLPKERFLRSCIRERWKGSSEFMFWAAFSYDKKGPCHCWSPETLKEKKEADEALKILNAELEPKKKEEWEIETGVRRLGLRNLPGKKPIWRWKKETGKLLREGKKGGIDWWRYQQKILCPKLLPFALECMKERPDTVGFSGFFGVQIRQI
ncbi:hypothetical protein FOBRF1_006637 [Fusarium oxysporum]